MSSPSAFLAALAGSLGPGPAPERRQHDRIAPAADSIGDAALGYPWRAESLLERLERRGDITQSERRGGEAFARCFRLAHLDPLRAADLMRDSPGRHASASTEDARRRTLAALVALGGANSLCGSAAWCILGDELSINRWALAHRMRHDTATGVLRGALGVLSGHFGT
jgi:hypothetical protein